MFYLCLGVSPPRSPPPPPLPHDQFLPQSKPTFWVSMGMNSQPPNPPCPAYPHLLLSPWILQLAYYYILWSPGATRGLLPHCGEIQPVYARHGDPYPNLACPQPLPCAPAPQPRWPSLSANYIDYCCAQSPPPPPLF